jgi:ribose 5-phosphate isomerase B
LFIKEINKNLLTMAKNGLKIALASDHAGYQLKEIIKNYLDAIDYIIEDYGTDSEDSVDYPDFVHPLTSDLADGKHDFGIVMCGSGNGVNMTANKNQKIRSALCWTPEIAQLARQHNDANVLAMPARFLSDTEALEIVKMFLSTDFEGGRHVVRIGKINGPSS